MKTSVSGENLLIHREDKQKDWDHDPSIFFLWGDSSNHFATMETQNKTKQA